MATSASASPPSTARILTLGALSAFGPLSMDLYLPGLPELTADFGATRATGQITMSACMIGLAVGQLILGPLSDRWGRRLPLRLGVGLFAVSSFACAFAPTMSLLIVLRFVQGFAGGAGIVVARAMVRDQYDAAATARAYSHLLVVTGSMPIVAPLVGGLLLDFTDWHGLFLTLGLVGLMLLVTATTLPESLPVPQRTATGWFGTRQQMAFLSRDSRFVALCAALGLSHSCLFSYIMMSPFVLEDERGFDPQTFSAVFATNGLALVLTSRLNARLLRRRHSRRLLLTGLGISMAGSSTMCLAALTDAPIVAYLIPLCVVIGSAGLVSPNLMSLAMRDHGARAGAAAGLLGMAQFGSGAVIGPLASRAGVSSTSMAITMLAVTVSSLAVIGRVKD